MLNSNGDRNLINDEPSPHYLSVARKLLFIIGSKQTDVDVKAGKLLGLDPIWSKGCWVTRGRFGKGLFRILGVSELSILLNTERLSYLIMVDAHNEDHREAKSTLARSRTQAWIVKKKSCS